MKYKSSLAQKAQKYSKVAGTKQEMMKIQQSLVKNGKQKISKVAILGDSILRGIILNDSDRYIHSQEIGWEEIEEQLDVKIVNYSKMGNTALHAEKQLDVILAESTDWDALILEFGGNDCDYNWGEIAKNRSKIQKVNTEYDIFLQTMESMLKKVMDKNISPILMTLPPIDSARYYDWFSANLDDRDENILYFLGDKNAIYRKQELYSGVGQILARKYDLDIVDVRKAFLEQGDFQKLLCKDGIHPNGAGEQLIVKAFIDYFEKI